jgi:8-hydroxy-5-deazaflavin:NADPH oxidoreductase
MRIGILGAGNVGGALGSGWARKGHQVRFGVRNPAKPEVQQLVSSIGSAASAGTVAEAGRFGEVVVLATPWEGTEQAVAGAGDLKGKVVCDCTNPLLPNLAGLAVGTTTSGGEQVASWARGARVVKIFNTTGAANMANPLYGQTRLTMSYCGDDADAKKVAAGLAADLGFDPVDAGPLSNARVLEPFALLWIYLGVFQGLGMNFAFQIVKRPA